MTLRAGEVFAGYTVVGQLGGGGMGEVYLAQHPRLPRQDALKILRADISADEGFRQRFIREADSVAALSHPNIVTVFDRGEFNGKLWIATEYVNGTDAAQLLRDRYPAGMPAVEAASIAAAIGDALDYAHERGLLHRDVKPANILLSEPDRTGRRRVFLADFGIARPMGDPSGLTATNFTVGTVSYAAPEQLMGADIDGRADQYALAATVFHLLAGKPPFEDSNPIAVISKHLTLPPPQLGALRPDLSGLDHILATAMAKDPNQRYPNCAEFTADLTHGATLNPVLPHAPTQAAVPAPVPSTPVPGPPANTVGSSIGHGTAPTVQRINTKSKIAIGAAGAVGAGVLIAIAAVGLNGKNAVLQHSQSGQSSGLQTRGNVTTAKESTGQSPPVPNETTVQTPATTADSLLVGPACAAYSQQVGPSSIGEMAEVPVGVALSRLPTTTTFAAALSGKLNPQVDFIDELNNGEFTIFAPTDQAFARLAPETIQTLKTDSDLLSAILTYHVVVGQINPDQVVGTHTTVQGSILAVTGSDERLKVNDADVICGGIGTLNATVYLIDWVLMPPATPAPTP